MEITLALIAAILPALALLYFIYRKDSFRMEPPRQILLACLYGMLSVPLSLVVSIPLLAIGAYDINAVTVGGYIRTSFFGAGLPEELAKLVMLWLFLRKCKYFDEWVDGIVYAACVGLGFALVENVKYIFGNYDMWVLVGSLRALFAIPGHFFFAVIMGYFYSKASFGDPLQSKLNSALALIVPMLLHAAFDSLLMISQITALSAAAISLFGGLYIFLAVKSRKFFLAHHQLDKEAGVEPNDSIS